MRSPCSLPPPLAPFSCAREKGERLGREVPATTTLRLPKPPLVSLCTGRGRGEGEPPRREVPHNPVAKTQTAAETSAPPRDAPAAPSCGRSRIHPASASSCSPACSQASRPFSAVAETGAPKSRFRIRRRPADDARRSPPSVRSVHCHFRHLESWWCSRPPRPSPGPCAPPLAR
jgi:hypothetical protein